MNDLVDIKDIKKGYVKINGVDKYIVCLYKLYNGLFALAAGGKLIEIDQATFNILYKKFMIK